MPHTVTRTYLELVRPQALHREGAAVPPDACVVRLQPVAPERFRALYADIGRAFHWHDRDSWSDERLRARFTDGGVSLWELRVAGVPAGFYELERHTDGSVEIVLFGLLPAYAGRGLGKWLLVDAADRAWESGATRVWLHTCTLDSPAALPNYLARGFQPYRTERYEVDDVGGTPRA